MDACLTQPIPVSMPVWKKYSGVPKLPGYTNISSLTPIVEKFLGAMPDSEGQIASDNLFIRVTDFNGSGDCKVDTVSKKKCASFCKVTHLLDPIRTIQKFYSDPVKGDRRRGAKLNNPMNQAYIDSLANYLLGQLRERNVSPHFCLFYGGYKGVAEKYRYNITGEYESYRRYRLFWERRRQGLFSVHYEDDESEVETPNSSMRSTAFHYSTPRSQGSAEEEDEVIGMDLVETGGLIEELESVHSFVSAPSGSSGSGSESYESEEDEPEVFIELKDFPVMLIFQEKMEGVLDDMLEDDGTVVGAPRDSKEWENRWIAWTFQVIAALCAAQGVLGFTHNDLHTNNIVWKATEDEWLYYVTRDGSTWKVPTYGKILCLIDFGRAIFRLGETWYYSDDYECGGDAEGQYRFGPLAKGEKPLYPNPSFDLCRYAVSVIDVLYPDQPAELLEGGVISNEGTWTVKETESPFWNLLWSWLIDDRGKNVLKDEDGEERFPDFDLYQHISEHVTNCKPQDQIHRDIFAGFKVPANAEGELSAVVKKYPLFC
jgi:hypothetical protein